MSATLDKINEALCITYQKMVEKKKLLGHTLVFMENGKIVKYDFSKKEDIERYDKKVSQ